MELDVRSHVMGYHHTAGSVDADPLPTGHSLERWQGGRLVGADSRPLYAARTVTTPTSKKPLSLPKPRRLSAVDFFRIVAGNLKNAFLLEAFEQLLGDLHVPVGTRVDAVNHEVTADILR